MGRMLYWGIQHPVLTFCANIGTIMADLQCASNLLGSLLAGMKGAGEKDGSTVQSQRSGNKMAGDLG